jgi:hypothetical protein
MMQLEAMEEQVEILHSTKLMQVISNVSEPAPAGAVGIDGSRSWTDWVII